jgi:hypothetical protein
MQLESCPQETAVVRANRSGRWEDSLAAHFKGCANCREAVRIAGWMQNLAVAAPQRRALPDPELLWIKSQLFGRQEAADRAFQPLWLGETLARAVVGAFAAAWLALSWPTIQAYLIEALTQSGGAANLRQSTGSPWLITAASLAAALALLVFARYVHPRLTRD